MPFLIDSRFHREDVHNRLCNYEFNRTSVSSSQPVPTTRTSNETSARRRVGFTSHAARLLKVSFVLSMDGGVATELHTCPLAVSVYVDTRNGS